MQKDRSKRYFYHRINPFFGSITNHARKGITLSIHGDPSRVDKVFNDLSTIDHFFYFSFLLSFLFFFFNLSKKISTTRYIYIRIKTPAEICTICFFFKRRLHKNVRWDTLVRVQESYHQLCPPVF